MSTSTRLGLRLVCVAVALTVAACGDGSDAPPASSSAVDITPERVRVVSAAAIVEMQRSPYRLWLLDRASGAVVGREVDAGGVFYERDGVQHTLTTVRSARAIGDTAELVVDTSEGGVATVRVRYLRPRTAEVVVEPPDPATLSAVGDRWDTPDDEAIYGLTSRVRDSRTVGPGVEVPLEDVRPSEVGSLNRRGETVDMFVRPTIALYAPFYHSSRGYGLAVAGTVAGAFDIAKTDPRVLSFRFETGSAPDSRRLTFHLFLGPDHSTIVDEYTALTGRPFVPPDWAFLNWRWRDQLDIGTPAVLDGIAVNAQLAEDVLMFEQLGIPAGVYLLDRPVLEGEFGFSRFVLDSERLPNPEATLSALHQRGYRILTWSSLWACGSEPADNGFEAQQLGFLAPRSPGTPHCADSGGGNFILDPTNPAARQWWQDKVTDFVTRYGIDGIKLDRGEEFIPSEASDIWSDGRTGREVRNAYPVLQAQVHHDALAAARGKDFLVITRSGYTGVQRHAIAWSGDVTGSVLFGVGPGTDLGLRSAIISQLRSAFMGIPIWGSDTGGYYEFKDRDVFARWIEFSTFCGIMEIGGKGTHAPWDMPTEPKYDTELIEIYRRYTQLRATLQTYVVAAARESAATGMPIARPLVFAFREDPAVRDVWDQYLFGPDLMVAPVWRIGDRTRQVYFPRGTWRSYWNDAERYDGPTTVTVDAPLDVIPVYVRGDAQVPRAE